MRASADMRDLPEALLWDMDGTLVDTEDYWTEAAEELLWEHSPTASLVEAEVVGVSLPNVARLLRERGVSLPVDEITVRQTQSVLVMLGQRGLRWRPGAQELLSAARQAGVQMALVTMASRPVADYVANMLPTEAFAVIVSGDDVEEGKPAPEAYEKALSELGISAAQCVAIEDSTVGLTAARAAGVRTVGVPFHTALEKHCADVMWDSLEGKGLDELAAVIRSRNI